MTLRKQLILFHFYSDAIFALHLLLAILLLMAGAITAARPLIFVLIPAVLAAEAVFGYLLLHRLGLHRKDIHPEVSYRYSLFSHFAKRWLGGHVPPRTLHYGASALLVVSLGLAVMI